MNELRANMARNMTIWMIAGLSGFGYYRYRRSETYSDCYHFVNKLKDMPDNLQVINLGSTNAYYAFDYTEIVPRAMNMATYTQSLEYDLKILRRYENKISEHAVILITLVYPIFLVSRIPSERKDVFNQFAKIFSRGDMPEWTGLER